MLKKTLFHSVLTIIILLLCPIILVAQEEATKPKTVILSGCVRNSFTGYGEGGASVSVYREDGSVVAPWCMLLTFGDRDRKGNEFRVEVPVGKYRIHVECEGYKPLDYWYEVKSIKRKQMIKLPDLMIQKDFTAVDEDKNVQLGEATVSATKIKMYYKGDTLVYNAAAFKLPDGSMLDELIRQLPGAELKGNGDIFINGRKLDYLLLYGICAFYGDFRGNCVFLFIDIIFDFRMCYIGCENTHHVFTEIFWDYDCRIIFSGFYSFFRFLSTCKCPVKLRVTSKSCKNLISKVKVY